MVLGYYKFVLKEYFVQSVRKFFLRRKNYIGKNCYISRGTILKGNNKVKNFSSLGAEVVLEKNVLIGSRVNISNIKIGENSSIDSGVMSVGSSGDGKIIIGRESYIGVNNVLDRSDNITIGNFVHIAGPSTGLWTHSSAPMCMNNIPLAQGTGEHRPTSPIIIEDNVYIGGNCTIYPGVIIHHHSIITPNSVVTENVGPKMMVGGVPAKIIRKIDK